MKYDSTRGNKSRSRVGAGLALAGAAGMAWLAAGPVSAGPDKIAFPDGYEKWGLYGTVDRYDNKQYRELYARPDAIKAAKEGKPVPYGSPLVMAIYKAQADAQGNPVKDGNGRFVKGELVSIAVMEKRRGWGAEYGEELRNGEWEYASFTPERKVSDKTDHKTCFNCHKPHDKQDYVMSWAKLGGTAPTAAAQKKTGPQDVNIAGFTFGPTKMTVVAGKPVTWTNTDDSPHQVVVTGNARRTGVLQKGASESLTFDQPGTYDYICGLHPAMKGSVEVTAAQAGNY